MDPDENEIVENESDEPVYEPPLNVSNKPQTNVSNKPQTNVSIESDNESDIESDNESTPILSGKEQNESIVIKNPSELMELVEPQKNKFWWHFKFVQENHIEQLKKRFESNNIQIKIEDDNNRKKSDMIVYGKDGTEIGYVHFLLFDKRDQCMKSKHYIKLYLFRFKDNNIFTKVRDVFTMFFDSLRNTIHTNTYESISETPSTSNYSIQNSLTRYIPPQTMKRRTMKRQTMKRRTMKRQTMKRRGRTMKRRGRTMKYHKK
jgi:hypothetical protein